MTTELVVLARGDDDDDLVERSYLEVLAPSFTDDEIPPLDEFLTEVAASSLLVATDQGEPTAVAVIDAEPDARLALLSYLAVRPGLRGTGVGSQMMDRLRDLWRKGDAEAVVGEVHDPRCWAESDDERPAARLRFYERNGARLLTVPWVQPRLRKSGQRVGGMVLLVWDGHAAHDSVPSDWMRDWMLDYYRSAEGTTDPTGDATVAALLARVGAVDPIPVRAVSDLVDVPLLDVRSA